MTSLIETEKMEKERTTDSTNQRPVARTSEQIYDKLTQAETLNVRLNDLLI